MDQVESWAKQVDAKHVLFVFDSCFSGTIFKQRSGKEKPLYIQSVMNKPVRQFLTAGDADQRVPAKSVFTPLFIRALEGEADVINRDGYVTGNELGNYLKQNLSEYTKTQTPQFGTIRDPDLDQGDIVFRALNTPLPRPMVNPSPVGTNSNRSPKNNSRATEVERLISLAETKFNKKDYQGAMQDANKAIELDPNSSQAYLNRGRAYLGLNDYQKAMEANNQAIKLNPNDDRAYNNRGTSKYKLGDNKGAIADFNQAIKLNPDLVQAYHNRGISKSDLGDDQGAIADYNQAIKLKPDYATAYFDRGSSKYNLGDYQGAIADYSQAIKLNPDYAEAYNNRGISKGKSGDNQGAIADFNQAIKLNPDDTYAYANRGFAKKNLGDNQNAISDFNQAIKLNPGLAKAYYHRGASKYNLGDNQNAINDFRQAAKLFQQQNNQEWYQKSLDKLKELGVSN
jgi:tetratricopeptide (TPR) repeat protein